MAYCSIEAAKNAGVTGTDAEVTAWITAAQEAIERYATGQPCSPSADCSAASSSRRTPGVTTCPLATICRA